MSCEFEARGLKLGPNIDRRAAANLIFKEYWEEWGGHPSMPSEFGVIPRHMMLYHLASDEIDWSETQPDDTNRLLENACNCSDKFEGDPAKLMWDLTGITSGDIILEGGYNERLENVVIAGKKHRIPWEEMSARDFLAPLFKLAELLPRYRRLASTDTTNASYRDALVHTLAETGMAHLLAGNPTAAVAALIDDGISPKQF